MLVAAFQQNEGKNQIGKVDANGRLYHDEPLREAGVEMVLPPCEHFIP